MKCPETLLVLCGVCRTLAFALLLIQFRPDVFVSEMRMPTVWRGAVLMAFLVLFGVCAWLVTPTTPHLAHPGWALPASFRNV